MSTVQKRNKALKLNVPRCFWCGSKSLAFFGDWTPFVPENGLVQCAKCGGKHQLIPTHRGKI